MLRQFAITLVVFFVFSCGAASIRPRYKPLPNLISDTVFGDPDEVLLRVSQLALERGLRTRLVSPAEGYYESDWFDLVTGRSRRSGGDPSRYFKVRFWTDAGSLGRTVLRSEVVVLQSLDPSLPERQIEMMAPLSHAGRDSLSLILDAITGK